MIYAQSVEQLATLTPRAAVIVWGPAELAISSAESVGPYVRCRVCGCDICEGELFNAECEAGDEWLHVCNSCVEHCGYCDEAMRADELASVRCLHGVERWCEYCRDSNASACEDCGNVIHEDLVHWCDDDAARCGSCAEARAEEEHERENGPIGQYHNGERHRETRKVFSDWTRRNGHRFFGVELEVEMHRNATRSRVEAAGDVLALANSTDGRLLWAENDGSLDDGFELITQPMGLDGQRALWTRVLSSNVVRGLRSHDTTTCGLHVHVSRDGLSSLTIAKAVCFLNDDATEDLVHTIARRSGSGYCKKRFGLKVGQGWNWGDRYTRLNTTPRHTVEFRLFRGSLHLQTVLGSIEFAHAVLSWCAQTSARRLTVESFLAFVYAPQNRADTAELRGLLARRSTGALRMFIVNLAPPRAPRTAAPALTASEVVASCV